MTAISCPVCQAPFQESVKEGILIDTCTQCRGVWLDRGELEKLLAAMRQEAGNIAPPVQIAQPATPVQHYAPPQQPHYPTPHHPHQGYQQSYRRDYDDDYRRHGKGYYKKSKMERLFDIFD
jgi:Zn-finger nucleic acid-binding protein